MTKKLMNRKAFTLIELAVVMVIIGILVTVLIPTFGMRDKANIAKAKGDVHGLHAAALGYLSAGRTTFTGIGITLMVTDGHLPTNFGTGAGSNPWEGDYTVAVDSDDATKVVITATDVPADAGADLARTFNLKSEGAAYAGTTFTVTF